jgi:hypothetical protein
VRYFNDEHPGELGAVIHAGDYVAPFAVKEFANLRAPFHGVFGNNDGERAGINKIMPQICEPPLHLNLGGRKIVVSHKPGDLSDAQKRAADIVICGHTHERLVEHRDDYLFVNPGELGGWLTGNATVAVIDTETLAVEILYLHEGGFEE